MAFLLIKLATTRQDVRALWCALLVKTGYQPHLVSDSLVITTWKDLKHGPSVDLIPSRHPCLKRDLGLTIRPLHTASSALPTPVESITKSIPISDSKGK